MTVERGNISQGTLWAKWLNCKAAWGVRSLFWSESCVNFARWIDVNQREMGMKEMFKCLQVPRKGFINCETLIFDERWIIKDDDMKTVIFPLAHVSQITTNTFGRGQKHWSNMQWRKLTKKKKVCIRSADYGKVDINIYKYDSKKVKQSRYRPGVAQRFPGS